RSSYPSVLFSSAFLTRYWVPAFPVLTHAASVIAPVMSNEGLSGATAYCVDPLSEIAAPCTPATQAGPPAVWAWLPFPEASSSTEPLPSSIFQWATSASAAEAVVNCQVWDQSPFPAAFE